MRQIYLIRHAKALDRDQWHHADELRPLTEVGYRQADGIARVLRRARIEGIASSRAFRCVDTVWPLADALGIVIRRHHALFEGATAADTLRLMRRMRGRRVALCTHGDVMQNVLETLDDEGVDLDGGFRFGKGAYWVLDIDNAGTVQTGTYHPAPRG